MANWKQKLAMSGIIITVVLGLIFVPIIIMNTDGNPGNDVQTFDDWIDSFDVPDPENDPLVYQLPDQLDAVGYTGGGMYPFLPSAYYAIADPMRGLSMYLDAGTSSGRAQFLMISNTTLLMAAMGVERERDMFCSNGTARVYWFNSLPNGRPLVSDTAPHPGYFYVINVAGAWYVNSVAGAWTVGDTVSMMANATGENHLFRM